MKRLLSLTVFLLVLSAGVQAASTDEIVILSQKGVGEDVMLAAVENSRTGFNMTAADILKLKDAKVPDRVIMAMLKRKNTGESAVAQPRVETPAAPRQDSPVRDTPQVAAGDGVLNIENLDDRAWSYTYEPGVQTIWIGAPTRDGRGTIGPRAGMSLRMRTGTYTIRYGQQPGFQVTVYNDEKSQIMLSRVDTNEMEALYVSVYERGEKKKSGKLADLRGARNDARAYSESDESRERVVEERIVERPSVVYRDVPTYVTPYYAPTYYHSYPRYYGSYYSRPTFSFGFSSGGSHRHHNHRSSGSSYRGGVRYGYR